MLRIGLIIDILFVLFGCERNVLSKQNYRFHCKAAPAAVKAAQRCGIPKATATDRPTTYPGCERILAAFNSARVANFSDQHLGLVMTLPQTNSAKDLIIWLKLARAWHCIQALYRPNVYSLIPLPSVRDGFARHLPISRNMANPKPWKILPSKSVSRWKAVVGYGGKPTSASVQERPDPIRQTCFGEDLTHSPTI